MIILDKKTLGAYREIEDKEDMEEATALAKTIGPINLYFEAQRFSLKCKREGPVFVNEYDGPDGQKIILRRKPEPDPENMQRLRDSWELDCSFSESYEHVLNLKQVYEMVGFEID